MAKRPPTKLLPPVEYLRECFIYNPKTGELRWRARQREHFANTQAWGAWNTKYAWTAAGCISPSDGYLYVLIDGRQYSLHRIVWKLITDEEPPPNLDHKDGNPLNNAWDNLRPASQPQQNWNTGLRKNNHSGYRGVSRHRRKWRARIMTGGVERYRLFDTPEKASAWREAMASKLHGAFYRPLVKPPK
jgi:hypothetical protein